MPMTETPQQRIERLRRELQEKGKLPVAPAPQSSGGTPVANAADPMSPEERIQALRAGAQAGMTAPTPQSPPQGQTGGVLGIVKDVAKDALGTLLVKPAARATEAIGRTGAFGKRVQQGYEAMNDEGGQQLSTPVGNYDISAVRPGLAGAGQIGGEALKAGSWLYGGQGAARVGGSVFGRVAANPIAVGAKAGAAAGGMYGAGDALEQGKGAGEVLTDAALGAGVGAVAGAAIPAVAKVAGKVIKKPIDATKGAIENRATRNALAREAVPDARAATVKVDKAGRIVPDKVAREAIRQGVPAADAAMIKASSAADRKSYLSMLAIRNTQRTMRTSERATDVVGRNFVERIAKPVQRLNREAGERLDVVAKGLAGKKVVAAKPVQEFAEALENAGIKLDSNGNIKSFRGSEYEGISSVQKEIQNVWVRLRRATRTGDAQQLHRLKRYIDSIVEYGVEGQGLKGKAATMLKVLRHNVDELLDTNFPNYNRANQQFAETIRVMERVNAMLGRSMRLGDDFADAKMGVKLRSIMSNSQSRSEILKVLKEAQETAAKYGVKVEDSIERQAFFADLLESLLGTEAPTSLLGQTEKAITGAGRDAAEAGVDLMRGNVIGAGLRGAKAVIEGARGITLENQLKAIEALVRDGLEEVAKKGTVFGGRINR